jgi:TolB-like protein/Tfp pilus assembly protein PilF
LQLFKELQRRNVFRVAIGYIVSCWLLVQVADVLFGVIVAPDWILQSIVVVVILGFPVVVFFSWAYEVTPEGIKREEEVDRSQSITHVTGRKLDRAIFAVLLISLGYFIWESRFKEIDDPGPAATREPVVGLATSETTVADPPTNSDAGEQAISNKSIAVLPFVNMSDDAGNEYFSDGLSEELLNLLAQIPDLKVAARTSSFSLKKRELHVSEIGEMLKVAHVLEGSVRKAGDQVRITAQLISTADGYHLWSESYDRNLDDIFAIQDEIAKSVVEQLKITIMGEAPKARKFDPQAYALYLEARHTHRQMTADSLKNAQALYEQSLQIDPELVVAMKGLASNLMNQENHGLQPAGEGYARAHALLEEALLIDPNSVQIHEGLGWLAIFHDNDLETAAYHYKKALNLDPSDPEIIGASAALLVHLGRPEDAIGPRKYAIERDPLNPVGYSNLGSIHYFTGNWDEAIASYRKTLELSPGYIGAHYFSGVSYLMKDEIENAREAFMQEGDDEYRTKGTALVHHALGQTTEFQETVAELAERWGAQWPSEVAHVYAWTGDFEGAFEWLEKSAAEEEGAFNPIEPLLDPLRADPRWKPLLDRIDKSAEQLDSIEFSVSLPE